MTYDRFGCGQSDKADAYTEAQPPAELEVLRGITQMACSGELMKHGPSSNATFDKIIHIGHSYGSFLTLALASKYPDLSDGAVFTGLIPNNCPHEKWAIFGWK